MGYRRSLLAWVLAWVAGCSDGTAPVSGDAGTIDAARDDVGTSDAGPPDAPRSDTALVDTNAPHAVCGNGITETGEDCDDGDEIADVICSATCHFTCGDGTVDAELGERCDIAITTGPGACPTTCDDGMACTADVTSGSGCQAECEHAPITVATSGDGCCPAGADATTDGDCAPVCGNMIVESPETCDTAIASGAGACPSSCDDGMSCTSDALQAGGTCTAACVFTPITAHANGDGCCPPGATPALDDDCRLGCGNGVVNPGETCDTAILVGPDSCPVVCSDGSSCTLDVLQNGATCMATCSFPPITMPASGDGCCPPGANNTNDTDCAPVCGNTIVEMGEQCDDGNRTDADACNNSCQLTAVPPTAFRMADLDLRDPHVFVSFLGCRDVTDNPLVGFSVNGSLQTSIQTDGTDPDTALDLSYATVFRPLDQRAGSATPMELHVPTCTSPIASTTCSRMPASSPPIMTMATSAATGTCSSPLAGTTGAYVPAIVAPAAPCYASGSLTLTLSLGGIPVVLHDATIAATYVGNPATTTVNGLVRGFLSEADANATIVPASFPLVGGMTLASLFAGGTGNCSGRDDRDTNGGVRGWWLYLNFTAPSVRWVDN